MSNIIKSGAWYFRIDPSNSKNLQRATNPNSGFSNVTQFNGAEIYDLTEGSKDGEVYADTSNGRWVRLPSGNIKKV